MRDILHAFAMVAVIAIAALCTLVQLSDVSRGFDQLGHDDTSVVQQVSSGTDDGPARPARSSSR
jgi:hypothetical protein